MRAMDPRSAMTLAVAAGLATLTALFAFSPGLAFLLHLCALLLALAPALYGPRWPKLIARWALILAFVGAWHSWPGLQQEQRAYRQHTPSRPAEPPR